MIRAVLVLLLASPVAALPVDRLPILIGDRVAGPATACIDRLDLDRVHLVAGGFVSRRAPAARSTSTCPSAAAPSSTTASSR